MSTDIIPNPQAVRAAAAQQRQLEHQRLLALGLSERRVRLILAVETAEAGGDRGILVLFDGPTLNFNRCLPSGRVTT
ncbi:MAG: hypothetical protein IT318_24835 [Anaerolineales bacterium]|nr:hypothetical protein [Anaerolineales bacterium]